MNDDDPARAGVRVVEGAVELARAEVRLALTEARAFGARVAVTAAISVVAVFLAEVAVFVLVLLPVLWAFRPLPALISLGIALALCLVTSLVAVKRWRAHRKPPGGEDAAERGTRDFSGRSHAIQR